MADPVQSSIKGRTVPDKGDAIRLENRRKKDYVRLLEQLEFAVKSNHSDGIKLALGELNAFRSR